MSGNLQDLRIDKDESGRRGSPAVRLFLALLLGAAGGAAAVWIGLRGFSFEEGSAPVEIVQAVPMNAARQTSKGSFTAGGWIEAAFPYPRAVVSLVKGKIEKMHVQDGQAVKTGDPIAEIYSRDLQEELAKAQAELDVLKRNLAVEKSQLALLKAGYRPLEVEEARAKLRELAAEAELWKSISQRSEKLAADGAASNEQAQSDRSGYETRKARCEAQKALVAKMEEGTRTEEISRQEAETRRSESLVADGEARVRIAATALEYAMVLAPMDGVVMRSFRDTGDTVNPMSPETSRIVWIYDPAKIWARADVSQADLGRIEVSMPVEIRIDASQKAYRGRVIRKNPLASLAKNTVEVKVEVLDPDGMLHPDMTARITFMPPAGDSGKPGAGAAQGLPVVPVSAVFREGGRAFVFVVSDSVARKRAVSLGEEKDGRVEVLSGLAAMESVVASDTAGIADGQKVRTEPRRQDVKK